MAAGPCVRVCLHFSDRDEETCWFLVDFKKMSTIECMQRVIGRKFYKNEGTSFKLTLKGSLLPAWESTFILRDDDQIIVQQGAAGRHSSEYWSKKKKQKKKLSTNAKKFHSPLSDTHNSQGCAETKNTGSLVDNSVEPTLNPQIFQNSIRTPSSETEEPERSPKKKKKKSDYTNEIHIDNEELPTPSKKQKISKSSKNDHSCKKINVSSKSKPEIIEVEKDHVKVVSSLCDNPKKEKVNVCNKNKGNNNPDLKKIESKLINVLHEVSLNSDNAIPMETSDTLPNGKDDVSKVLQKNTSEGSTSLIQSADSHARDLGKDLESGLKSDLEKSYNVQGRSSFQSVQEKVEVYKIARDDLKSMCQSLRDGETLTIDQDKAKVIDIENASNSSWFDCVEVDSFPDESKKHDTSSAKESSKGSGNNPRRRRRRRGQRSFACSPFVHAMCQNLDSDADNKSPLSTPVASQLKLNLSSNSSQKHFHFDSDTDEEEDVDEEENSSQSKTAGTDQAKTENNSENSKSALSSKKIVVNGAEDSNSSFVFEAEEKDKSSSSTQKTAPKKSVHFALENITCESFDSNQGPIVYKRGQNSSQRRNYPTLMRQQQLNTSFDSCPSIGKSVEEDPDAKSVNGCPPSKPAKEYNLLPAIVGYPRAGDKIAFKRLEIGEDYTPRLSDFIEAKVVTFQEDTKMLTMKITSSQNNRRKEGKFELFYEDDRDLMILDQPDDIPEIVELNTLQEIKLLK